MPHRFFGSDFRWNDWNRAKVEKHGLSEYDVEHAVRYCEDGYPRRSGSAWLAKGRFFEDDPPGGTLFVFHAMRL
jgi:hypothetical protein